MAWGPPTNLSHLLRDELTLRVTCACVHVAEPDVLTLRQDMRMARRGEELRHLTTSLRCGMCGEQALTYELVK